MRDFIEQLGAKAVSTFNNVSGFCVFCLKCLREFLQGSFFNRAAFDVLVMQIFFTAYQLLNFFVVLSAVFGSIFIGIVFQTVKSFGLIQYLGNIVMGVVVLEFSPLITVVLLALRSSSAVNSEIAVMKVNREIDALESFGIDPVIYLVLPRIIRFIISVTVLSSLFAIIVLFSGFIF
ncbi:ABC transporter permease, partial [bacterium]|nr:ABC transporter permease [bacterium]